MLRLVTVTFCDVVDEQVPSLTVNDTGNVPPDVYEYVGLVVDKIELPSPKFQLNVKPVCDAPL